MTLFITLPAYSQSEAWFLGDDPNIHIPFMENVGIYGNLYVQNGARGQVIGGTAWLPLPTIMEASDWLKSGDLIYGATPSSATEFQWHYLYSPSTDDVIPGAEWRPIASLTELTTTGVIAFDPSGAEDRLDTSWAIPDALGTYQKLAEVRQYNDPYAKVYPGIRHQLYSVSIDMGPDMSASDYEGWVQTANYSETIGGATEFTITHNQDCYPLVQIAAATGSHEVVHPLVQYVDADNIMVKWPDRVIAANSYTVNVLAASGEQTIGNGVDTEFNVTTSTDTRNCFVQVWETAGYGRLVYTGIAHNTVDSVTVTISPAPDTDKYTVAWGIIGDTASDFTNLFVMLDGSNRGSMTGTHGNPDIDLIANTYTGDGSLLTEVHAAYLLDQPLGDVAPVHNYLLEWNEDYGWIPTAGLPEFSIFYVNGQVFYPGFRWDSMRFNFDDGFSMSYTTTPIKEVTISIDPNELDEFVLKAGDSMTGALHMQNNNITGVDQFKAMSIFADQAFAGQSIYTVTKFQHDLVLGGDHMQTLYGRFSNIKYIDGIIVERQPVVDTPVASFMPYNAAWYTEMFITYPGGIDGIFYKKTGDTITGTMNANGQVINNPTAVNVRSDGQIQFPSFDAANAPDPANATEWFYDKLPERGVGFFKQTSINWFYGTRLDSKLYLQKMLTEAEKRADTEARVHHMVCMVEPGVSRYVKAVTRWPI